MDSMSETSSVASSCEPTEDVEVKKLKDLVKKLEKQNEHLRSRTGKLNSNSNKLKSNGADLEASGDYKPTMNMVDEFDDLAVLDESDELFADIDDNDPSAWLFRSPHVFKTKSRLTQKQEDELKMTPQEWLLSEIKPPTTSKFSTAKRSLLSSRPLGQTFRVSNSISKSSSEPAKLSQPPTISNETYIKPNAVLENEENRFELAAPHPQSPSFQSHSSNHNQHSHHRRRRSSHDEDLERNSSSSGSPHHSHHLPVPSQTMTTVHGLLSTACLDEEDIPQRNKHRPSTPTRLDSHHKGQDRRQHSQSPRSNSPARKRNVRRTLPNTSTMRQHTPRQSLPSTMPPPKTPADSGVVNSNYPPIIKSSLATPSTRMSRLTARSGLPTPSTPGGRGIPAPRSMSPMTSSLPRRTLPRPSQTSTSMRYLPKPTLKKGLTKPTPVVHAPVQQTNGSSSPPVDIWGDDEEVY